MTEDKLRDLFAQLPPHVARPGFSARVRARVQRLSPERDPRRCRWVSMLVASAAGVLFLVGVAVWAPRLVSPPRRASTSGASTKTPVGLEQARLRLEALRRERELLERQRVRVQMLLAEASPVVYLGGTERFDLVLDLSREVGHKAAPKGRLMNPPVRRLRKGRGRCQKELNTNPISKPQDYRGGRK